MENLQEVTQKLEQLTIECNSQKEKFDSQVNFLEKRNQDIQDLLASNPATRPIMIEKSLENVKECFDTIGDLFKVDQDQFEQISELEDQLLDAQQALLKTKLEFEAQIKDLKEQLENSRDLVQLEYSFKFEDKKKELVLSCRESEARFESEIRQLKQTIEEKQIDECRFTELNKTLNERLDIGKEIEDIRDSMDSQIKLKDDELEELRSAIGHFQKALEDSRMREMNSKE